MPSYYHSVGYGSGARAFAQRMHSHQESIPEELTYKPFTAAAAGMACTTLVISAWQAALGSERSEQYMARDARYTSPPALHGYLLDSSDWKYMGAYGKTFTAPDTWEELSTNDT